MATRVDGTRFLQSRASRIMRGYAENEESSIAAAWIAEQNMNCRFAIGLQTAFALEFIHFSDCGS